MISVSNNGEQELEMTFDEKMTQLFSEMGMQVDPVTVEDKITESEEK